MNKKNSLLSALDTRKSLLAGLISAASVVCGILPFFYIINILDMLARKQAFELVLQQCIIVAGLLIAKSVLYGIGMTISHNVAFSVLADIRKRIITHMERLSLSDIAEHKTGEFAQIVNHEVEQVELFLAHALPELLVALLIPSAILVFMSTISWQFAFVLFLQIPVLVVFMKLFMKRYGKVFDEFSKRTSLMNSELLEYIEGIKVIKVFNTGKGKTNQILSGMKNYIAWVNKVSKIMDTSRFIQNCIINSGIFFVAVLGSRNLLNGTIDYKTFVIGIIFAGFFGESVEKLLLYTFKVMKFSASRKSILSVLDIPEKSQDSVTKQVSHGDIVFDFVSFSYEDTPAVDKVSFTALRNTKTALVGASGSGKTTMGKLLNGFLRPSSGEVRINGVPTHDMSEESLAELVSYVQQEPFIFNTSIYENILIGNPEASEQQVHEAAQKAQLHEFIRSLPKGYDTQAGEGGNRLSGGEKQRISLARMILKDAPIVVLDEATAALDVQNERKISKAIEAFSEGKTRLVITHRMDTVRDVEQIIVIDNGRIVDKGAHKELITRCHLYKQLIDAQNAVERWTVKEGFLC
jgi:ATP-binding cassette subfamily B protein IrtA